MITAITVKGWKSFRSVEDFELRSLNIFIGQNGAGKSNFLGLFRLFSYAYAGDGLRYFVRLEGGANRLLHCGTEYTREIEWRLRFDESNKQNDYRVRLVFGAGDTLFFAQEQLHFTRAGRTPRITDYGRGHDEPALRDRADKGDLTSMVLLKLLRGCQAYQFHNTSVASRMRQRWSVNDGSVLKMDGGNLAPVLYHLRERYPRHFERLEQTLRLALPQFAHFVLDIDTGSQTVFLQWRETGLDYVFDAAQASDGTLRLMATLTLLMQPKENLPDVLLFDEPELGLHPAAIELIAEQIRSVSQHTQILLATQSAYLLNFFAAEDIVVADRHGRETTLRRLSSAELEQWLAEYTLSQLWEKNVLGGKP